MAKRYTPVGFRPPARPRSKAVRHVPGPSSEGPARAVSLRAPRADRNGVWSGDSRVRSDKSQPQAEPFDLNAVTTAALSEGGAPHHRGFASGNRGASRGGGLVCQEDRRSGNAGEEPRGLGARAPMASESFASQTLPTPSFI